MSILIKGIDMPKNCDECWKKYHGFGMVEHDEEWGTFYCKLAKGFCSDPRTKCPLIPVPPHGRLIDADALVDKHFGKEFLKKVMTADKDDLGTALVNVPLIINNAPTIIEAEEGET